MRKNYLEFCQVSHILGTGHHNRYFSGQLLGHSCISNLNLKDQIQAIKLCNQKSKILENQSFDAFPIYDHEFRDDTVEWYRGSTPLIFISLLPSKHCLERRLVGDFRHFLFFRNKYINQSIFRAMNSLSSGSGLSPMK